MMMVARSVEMGGFSQCFLRREWPRFEKTSVSTDELIWPYLKRGKMKHMCKRAVSSKIFGGIATVNYKISGYKSSTWASSVDFCQFVHKIAG